MSGDSRTERAFPLAAYGVREPLAGLRVRCVLRAEESARLPLYLGSTLRGGLASAFRHCVCTTELPQCEGCNRQSSCLYPLFFESPFAKGEQAVKRLKDIPHPYVIEPPLLQTGVLGPGETLTFDLVLIGKSVEQLPLYLFALRRMAAQGLGRERHHFSVVLVSSQDGQVVLDGATHQLQQLPAQQDLLVGAFSDHPETLTLEFVTPTRIMREGLIDRDLLPESLVLALARRIEVLLHLHCGVPLDQLSLRAIQSAATSIEIVESQIEFTDWQRYSNRQKQAIKMGGMTGRVVWSNVSPEVYSLLRAGEYLHVGKGAVMGMGRYAISTLVASEQSQRNQL